MRKTLVFILSLVLVAGFGTIAFAGHNTDEGFEYTPNIIQSKKSNIDISGSIRVRGNYQNNTSDFANDVDLSGEFHTGNDQKASWDTRVRLKIDAKVSPNTMGVIELESSFGDKCKPSFKGTGSNLGEIGDLVDYDDPSKGCFDWKEISDTTYDNADTFGWGDGHSFAGMVPFSNAKRGTLRIRQAYIVHQNDTLLDMPIGFKIGHILPKLGNGLFYNHAKHGDDALVIWAMPVKDLEVSLMYAKLYEGSSAESDDFNLWNLGIETVFNNVNLGADISYLDFQNGGDIKHLNFADQGIHLWNYGFRADTDFQGIKVYGDLEIQQGEISDKDMTPEEDLDFEGYAWMVGAAADIPDTAVSLHAEIAYGSGQDPDSTADEITMFVNSLSASQKYTFVYEYSAMAATGMKNSGISNTIYFNLGGDIDVNPDLNISADYYFLTATEAISLNGAPESDELGSEIDGKLTYQLDSNLVYYIEGGYLFAGEAYDHPSDEAADNAYRVRNGLVLKF